MSESAATRLPAAPPDLVGRHGELETLGRLSEAYLPQSAMCVLMTGPAGVGKTALLAHWAHQVHDRFPDGQWYVDLGGENGGPPMTADQALEALLEALGVVGTRLPEEVTAKALLFRSLLEDRRMLVVLDNATAVEQVRHLAASSPGCMTLIAGHGDLSGLRTSDGVHELPVRALSAESATALLGRRIGTARVAAEPAAASELAGLCGHLPLALLIAAEQVAARPSMTLADLATQLADQRTPLEALRTGGDNADDESDRAVRTVVSWTRQGLPPEASRMFALLGLHVTRDTGTGAAAALAGTSPDRARGLLETLTGAYLLQENPQDRFALRDPLYGCAVQSAVTLPAAEQAAAVRRVLTWFLHTADAATEVFSPLRLKVSLDPIEPDLTHAPENFASPQRALDWCQAERANLVAATVQAARYGHHDIAWKLAAVTWDFFRLRGPGTDWITTHRMALDSAEQIDDLYGQAWTHNNLGTALKDMGRLEDALRHYEQALALNRRVGHRQGEGWTRYNLGDALRELGELTLALDHLRKALTIAQEVGGGWNEAYTRNMLGDIHRSLGQFDEARRCLLPALVLNRQLAHRRGEGFTLHMIGDSYRDQGRFDRALPYYTEALAIRRQIGDLRGEGITLHCLGETCQSLGDLVQARRHYEQAFTVRRSIGHRHGEAQTLSKLATLQEQTGELDTARQTQGQAESILQDLNVRRTP